MQRVAKSSATTPEVVEAAEQVLAMTGSMTLRSSSPPAAAASTIVNMPRAS